METFFLYTHRWAFALYTRSPVYQLEKKMSEGLGGVLSRVSYIRRRHGFYSMTVVQHGSSTTAEQKGGIRVTADASANLPSRLKTLYLVLFNSNCGSRIHSRTDFACIAMYFRHKWDG